MARPDRIIAMPCNIKQCDTEQYNLTPPKTPYAVLPPPWLAARQRQICAQLGTTGTSCVNPANLANAKLVENGLADNYYQYLLTGGTGQTSKTPDQRILYDGQGREPSSARPVPAHIENIPL